MLRWRYRQFNGCYTNEYEFMDCISTGQYKIINIDSLYEDFEEIFYSVFLKMAQMFCYYKVIIIVIIQLVSKYKTACPLCHFVKYSPVNKRIAHAWMIRDFIWFMITYWTIKILVTWSLETQRMLYFDNDPFKIMAKLACWNISVATWYISMFRKYYAVWSEEE